MSPSRPGNAAPLLALASAGPLFLTSTCAAGAYLKLPLPLIVEPAALAQFAAVLIPAILVGGVLGLVPILLGNALMSTLATHFELAREPAIWWLVGAAAGAALALVFGVWPHEPATAFGLIFTSAACAGICRTGLEFDT